MQTKVNLLTMVEEIAFDGKSYWSFENDYARNVAIFGVYNSSSSHTDKSKK